MEQQEPQDGAAILRRIATYVPGSLVPAVLTLVTSMVFTRIFDATEFGVYGLVLVVANTSKVVLTMWLIQAIGKFLPPEQSASGKNKLGDAVLLGTCGVLLVEGLVGAALLVLATAMFPLMAGDFLAPAIAFVLIGSVFDILGSVFPAEHRARESVSFKLVDSVATFGLRLLMVSVVVGMGITAMLWSVCVSNAVLVPVMWVRAGLPSPLEVFEKARNGPARRLVRRFGRYGLPMTLWYFASLLLDVADRFVIGYFDGADAVGIYDANYRLITGGVALMIVPITATLAPMIMGLAESARSDSAAEALGRIVENLIVLGVLAVGITSIVYPYLSLLLGADFRSGSVIMPIVLAGVFAFNIGTFVHKPFEMIGRTRPMLLLIIAAAAVNLVLNVALVPIVGYIGAAYATFVSYVSYTVGIGLWGRRIVPWRLTSVSILKDVAVNAFGCVAIYMGRETVGGSGVVAAGLTVGACAALGLWSLGRIMRRVSAAD